MSERKNRLKQAIDFVCERLPLHHLSFEHMVTKKEVPIHRMGWAYYMGGLTLLFFLIPRMRKYIAANAKKNSVPCSLESTALNNGALSPKRSAPISAGNFFA